MSDRRRKAVDESGEENVGSSKSLDRRSYLKATAAMAAVAGVGSAASSSIGTASGSSDHDTVLNAVEDLGMDNSGGGSITGALERYADSNTRIEFPDGQYRVTGQARLHGYDNLALVGVGDDVEFVVENFQGSIIHVRNASRILVDNIDVNQTASGAAGHLNFVCESFAIRDVTFYGDEGTMPSTGQFKIQAHVTDPNGEALIHRVEIRGKSPIGTYLNGTGGIRAARNHRGTLRIRDCYIEHRPNNGMYCSRTKGPVIVENTTSKNNTISQIRLGHPDSVARNCTVIVDDTQLPDGMSASNMNHARGIWFESGGEDHSPGGVTAEDCDIKIDSVSKCQGAVSVHKTTGHANVKNCRIEVNEDGILGVHASSPNTGGDRPVTWRDDIQVEGTSITGDASGGNAIGLSSRNESTVTNCCIQQPGSDRGGVRFSSSSGCTVESSTINVSGSTVSGAADKSGISTSGSCPAPEFSDSDGSEEDEEGNDEEGVDEADANLLAFVTDSDASGLRYSFTADGPIEFTTASYDSPSGNTIEGGTWTSVDNIEERDEEWYAEGGTGNGYGDAYAVVGQVTGIDLGDEDQMWVELDGERMSPEEIIEATATESGDESGDDTSSSDGSDGSSDGSTAELSKTIVIDGSGTGDVSKYSFTVTGEVERDDELTTVQDGGLAWDKLPSNVSDGTVVGIVGRGQDAFRFSGELADIEIRGDANVDLEN